MEFPVLEFANIPPLCYLSRVFHQLYPLKKLVFEFKTLEIQRRLLELNVADLYDKINVFLYLLVRVGDPESAVLPLLLNTRICCAQTISRVQINRQPAYLLP